MVYFVNVSFINVSENLVIFILFLLDKWVWNRYWILFKKEEVKVLFNLERIVKWKLKE